MDSPVALAPDTWQAVRDRFLSNGDASEVLKARTAAVDNTVVAGFERQLAPVFPRGLALLAVGGYGRGELFPYSDIDLLILSAGSSQNKYQKEALALFLRELWDSGLRLSQSVHTPQECCELHESNVELNVSLLDHRLIAGDRTLFASVEARFPQFLNSSARELARRLARLVRSRHARYHNTIYHLEPNVKETPGGVRDLHLISWMQRLRVLPAPLPEGTDDVKPFLYSVRCFLHFRNGRDNNVLSFDAQEEAAEQLPYAGADPGAWMREYYRAARAVHRAALAATEAGEGPGGSLLTQFRDWRARLSNSEFTVARDRVYLRSPQQLETDPEQALRLFRFVALHGIALAPDTERRIAGALPAIQRHYADTPLTWTIFREVLAGAHAPLALRSMHNTGVLRSLIPEWEHVECLVVRDFYHRYTVDEHTLVAIETLLLLRQAGEDISRRRFADLLNEIDNVPILLMALLLHDVGKGFAGRDHAGRSVRIAASIAARMGMPEPERRAVLDLIAHHLELSLVMTARDLEDPNTSRELAQRVGTVEQLKALTLLTYADVSAVHPGAMTPWRLEQLWSAYMCTHRELTRELVTDRIQAKPSELPDVLDGFPTRYLLTHLEPEVQAHVRLLERSEETGAAVEIEKRGSVYVLAAVAKDRPYLFASIAGALASFGLNIVKAEAFNNRRGDVLDTFSFEDPGRNLELNASEVDRLRLTLERVLLGRIEVKELLRGRPHSPPPSKKSVIKPSVVFDGEASETATLIEIVAQDRPGLLYDLASTISKSRCNIEVVLIDTEAHKAIDVFYITRDGRKLTTAEELELQSELLRAAD